MILELTEAQKIDQKITQRDLNAYEEKVRILTNNHFHVPGVRITELEIGLKGVIKLPAEFAGLFKDDTVEISGTRYNDGLYTVAEISAESITLNGERWVPEIAKKGVLILVKYPDDVLDGVSKLISYRVKMGSKSGLKSKTVARMSETYFDVNATDNVDGFPASMFSFLDKYKKLRWS